MSIVTPPSVSLPTGTVTFLFTDIEGSTQLLHVLRENYAFLLAEHLQLLRAAFAQHQGHVIDTQGDAFFVAFQRALDAVNAAVAAQHLLAANLWPEMATLRVRMGLHTGEPRLAGDRYIGMDVHRAARIGAAGHGGQVLLSKTTADLARDELPEGVSLRDLGEHRLKDLQRPEHLFQLVFSDLPSDFSPLKSLDALPNNLPVQLTSFIGRELEIAEVKRLLNATRLLTLTGVGGTGKTRLALQAAAEVLEAQHFKDGVWVIELEQVSDPGIVPQVVAAALGVREAMGRPVLTALINYLNTKAVLLILDNCEHLLDACAALADAILHAAPRVKILVSSREALGVGGEIVFHVPSLTVADIQHLPPLEELLHYEAVRLFVDRAVAIQTHFALTRANAKAVAQICYRLDGLPLAIELAAACVNVLSVDQIASRLDDRLRLLTHGSRTALPRHQTLQATIDWSYGLLSTQQQTLLRRLSAFVGGCTLEAVESVCADVLKQSDILSGDVLDLLSSLVNKSLVIADTSGFEQRYDLLETIREYTRAKLVAAGEEEMVRARHLDWFLQFAERAEHELHGVDQVLWLDRLELEYDNFLAALDWSMSEAPSRQLKSSRHERGLQLAAALWWFWRSRGSPREGRERLTTLLGQTPSPRKRLVRAKALFGAGALAFAQGDFAAAHAFYDESLVLCRQSGGEHEMIMTLNGQGALAQSQSDFAAAQSCYDEALALSRKIGFPWGIASSLLNLGYLRLYTGDYAAGSSLFEQSLAISRQLGDEDSISWLLMNLGLISYYQADYARARVLYEESLAFWHASRNKARLAILFNNLAFVELHERNYDKARTLFVDSLNILREIGNLRLVGDVLEGLAGLAAAERRPELAARFFGAAQALFESIGLEIESGNKEEHEHNVNEAREQLDEAAFATAWEEGRKMSIEEAMQYALRTMDRSSEFSHLREGSTTD